MEYLYTRKLCQFAKSPYQKKDYYLIFLGITSWDKKEPIIIKIEEKLLILQPFSKVESFDKDKVIIKNFLKSPKRKAIVISEDVLKKMNWDMKIKTVFVYYNQEKELCLIGDLEKINQKRKQLGMKEIQIVKTEKKKEKMIDRLLNKNKEV